MVTYGRRLLTRIKPQGLLPKIYFMEIIYYMQSLSYNMCSSMLNVKFFVYSKQHSTHSKHKRYTIRRVIAYKRLKNNGKILNRKPQIVVMVVYRRWLFARDSSWKALTGNNDVLDRWLLMGGGRTWSFDWVINTTVDEVCNLQLEYFIVSTAIWLRVSFTICKINGGSFLYKKLG